MPLLILVGGLFLLAVLFVVLTWMGAPLSTVHYYLRWLICALAVVLFSATTVVLIIQLLQAFDKASEAGKPALWVETHWGGLGGGLGGWHLSPALGYLILTAVIGGLLVASAVSLVPSVPAEPKKANEPKQTGQTPAPPGPGSEKKQ